MLLQAETIYHFFLKFQHKQDILFTLQWNYVVPWCSGRSSIWPRVSGWGCPYPLTHSRGVSLKAANLSRTLMTVSSPSVAGGVKACCATPEALQKVERQLRSGRLLKHEIPIHMHTHGSRFNLEIPWRCVIPNHMQLFITFCFNVLWLHPCATSLLGRI